MRHARRELLWVGVTAHPNAQWIAQQLTEAYCWNETPQHLVRDRDSAYGEAFIRRIDTMRLGRIYPLARMHQHRARSGQSDGCFHCQSWPAYIINTCEFEFPTRTGIVSF